MVICGCCPISVVEIGTSFGSYKQYKQWNDREKKPVGTCVVFIFGWMMAEI